MDWSSLFALNVSPWELIVRGSVMYWFLFLVFRFLLRRDVGSIGVADVLLVVLIADASQNAMTAGYTTVSEGLVLVSTLIAWNYLLDWLSFHVRAIERFIAPPPLQLIRRGRILRKHLRAELVTVAELWSHLREAGIESLADVKSACLESDGKLSVIRFDPKSSDPPVDQDRKPGR
ncbi:MAG: YetF domain-containing protein [Caldimonas sp.]